MMRCAVTKSSSGLGGSRRWPVAFVGVVALAVSVCAAVGLSGCATVPRERRSYVVRLRPGQDVKVELTRFARAKGLRAASIVSAVGSLTNVALRFANRPGTTRLSGHFEVVSLSGYLAAGEFHLHMAVSDGEGKTVGGHVMKGNLVYTTLVVAIDEHLHLRYRRQYDPASKYQELVIEERQR